MANTPQLKNRIMKVRDDLIKIHSGAYCLNLGYNKDFVVYDNVYDKNVLGRGNSLKNAYGNALDFVNKQKTKNQ
jgi:hypothetical protein